MKDHAVVSILKNSIAHAFDNKPGMSSFLRFQFQAVNEGRRYVGPSPDDVGETAFLGVESSLFVGVAGPTEKRQVIEELEEKAAEELELQAGYGS